MTGFNPTPRCWLQTEADYEAALERISTLMDAAPNTPEEDELDVLATLVEVYEDQNYPINFPDPLSAITRQARSLLRSRSDVEYIIADVQREQVPESQSLLTPPSGAKKRKRRKRRNEHYRREEWN